jgi:hypothetical protein
MSQMPTESTEDRVKRLIPKVQDCTLILLKGHLLIEEQLQGLVEVMVKDAKPLGDARFSFHQWLCLGKSLTPGIDDLWKFVELLNQTRNKMAHHAEVAEFDKKIDALIQCYAEEGFTASSTKQDRASRFRATLALVCGILHGMAQMFGVAKASR